jgi:hypothetical protein
VRDTLKKCSDAEEHDIFANLALKWLSIALDRETRIAIDLARFDDDGGALSVSVASRRLKPEAQVCEKKRAPAKVPLGTSPVDG